MPQAQDTDTYLTGLAVLAVRLTCIYLAGLIFTLERRIMSFGVDCHAVLVHSGVGLTGLFGINIFDYSRKPGPAPCVVVNTSERLSISFATEQPHFMHYESTSALSTIASLANEGDSECGPTLRFASLRSASTVASELFIMTWRPAISIRAGGAWCGCFTPRGTGCVLPRVDLGPTYTCRSLSATFLVAVRGADQDGAADRLAWVLDSLPQA